MTELDLITKMRNALDRCKNEPSEPLKLVGTPEQIAVWKKMFGENACTYIERV